LETVSYIIGDIHGQDDKLERLLASIESRHHWKSPKKKGKLIFLGDYIDRGPNSQKVIDLAMQGISSFSSVYLKGNHEQLLIEALNSSDRNIWNNWMSAGGETTLKSFGYDLFESKYDHKLLIKKIGEERTNWLLGLELTHQFDDVICVHAGFNPEIQISNQTEKDMLWIRKRFLNSNHKFAYGVVHGHTPHDQPVVKSNRICVDTGAGMGGELTTLVIDKSWLDVVRNPDFISIN